MQSAPPTRSKMTWPMAFFLAVLIFGVLAAFVFYRIDRQVTQQTEDLKSFAESLRDAFVDITNVAPVITVNEKVYFAKEQPVLELAVVSGQEFVERETTGTFFGSTKRYRARGTYEVKAGFNLKEPVEVVVITTKDGTQKSRISLPTPQILSVEQKDFELLQLEDGIWNKITPRDIEKEVLILHEQARIQAAKSDLPQNAVERLASQLAERIGKPVEIVVKSATAQPLR